MIKYAILGLSKACSDILVSCLSGLKSYELTRSTENKEDLLDLVLASSPNLIFVNVDQFSTKDFKEFTTSLDELYRTALEKPYVVAVASDKSKAYNCIKVNLFYYLLKPITHLELQKIHCKLQKVDKSIHDKPKQICLKVYNDYEYIDIKDILFLKSDNNTTEFYMLDNSKVLAYKTLKHFQHILPPSFKRIHQSFIINQNYISRIHLGRSECYLKPHKQKIPFSKAYKKDMTELANSLSKNSILTN